MLAELAGKVFTGAFGAQTSAVRRPILCVSGGMDSVFLLKVYEYLWKEHLIPQEPAIFHLDHKVREDSAEDAEFCARLAYSAGFAFYIESMSAVVYARRTGQSLEEAGRTLRYRTMRKLMRTSAEPVVFVTAHHADDYLESMILHLTRGGGPGSLSTLPLLSEVHGVPVFRPLMILGRAQIAQCMKNVAYREDVTNRDPQFKRNRIRAQIVPMLKQEGMDPVRLWRNFHETLASPMLAAPQLLRLDRAMFTGSARVLKTALDAACIRLGLGPQPETVIGELLRQSARSPFRIRFESSELLLWSDERSDVFLFPSGSLPLLDPSIENPAAGEWLIRRGEVQVTCRLERGWKVVLPEPGMRLPLGAGRKKLKKHFQEQSVPSPVRRHIPVALDGEGLVRRIFFSFWDGEDRQFEHSPSKKD